MDWESGWDLRQVAETGALLRELRLERRISQNQLADEAGVNVSQISRVEAGQDGRLSTLLRIFDGLGYRARFDYLEVCDEAGDLLSEESWRRHERRAAGLLMGSKRWR